MGFNGVEFRRLRIQRKITVTYLAEKLKVSRKAIHNWETGINVPTKNNIAKIASVLKVRINDLTCDSELLKKKESMLNAATRSWMSLFKENSNYKQDIVKITSLISEFSNSLSNATILISGIASSLHFPLYIKNLDNRYILVNNTLLEYFSLDSEFDFNNKSDINLLPKNEAVENFEEDNVVLTTGEGVFGREGYIPGTRKKKTGIITKAPIIDSSGTIVGLIGFFVDITKRKISEEKRILMENAFDKVDVSIFILKQSESFIKKYKLVFANKYFRERIPGISGNSLGEVQRTWQKNKPIHYARLIEKIETTDSFPINYKYLNKTHYNEETIWFTETVYNLLDGYYLITNFDITQLNWVQQKGDILHSVGVGKSNAFAWKGKIDKNNNDIIIDFVNENFEMVTGYKEEVINSGFSIKMLMPKEEFEEFDYWLEVFDKFPVLKHFLIKEDNSCLLCETKISSNEKRSKLLCFGTTTVIKLEDNDMDKIFEAHGFYYHQHRHIEMLKVAENMLKKNIDIDTIIEITGLYKEEIEAIQKTK